MMSGLGISDGTGGSGGKVATVFCSRCNAENEIQLDEVQYTSSCSLIVCKSCDGEIVLNDDWVDPGMTIVGITGSDKGTLEQQLQCESTDKRQEERAERPVGLRPRSHQRKLKPSASCTDCGFERSGPTMVQHSASLSAIAQNGSVVELTADSLKLLSTMIKERPCPNCGCTDRDLLLRVEGIDDTFYCYGCDRLYGLDDGMNFFDFQEFLNMGYRMDPCSFCGNDDPEKFTLERSNAGLVESKTDLVVRCSICEKVSPRGLGQVMVVEENMDVVDVSCTVQCSKCGNRDSQKFEVQTDACNNTIETICMVCNDRKATEVTDQVCSCEGAPIDYGFDEYGYISKIKCNACGAVMKTGDDAATKKTSSDGSSRGRTRIQSLDMVRPGDHIAWHQLLGYWHHAIVVEVQFDWINLIHYNGPSAHKGVIVDEWRALDPTKEEVYRIDYHREAGTYGPDVVIKRARSRLGEHNYNLVTNNCEHFARWCVTGQHRSVQVQTFYESVMSRMNVAAKGRLAQSLMKNGLNFASKRNLQLAATSGDRGIAFGKMLLGSGDKASSGICTQVAAGEAKSVASGIICSKGLSAGFAVGYEIYSVITDIHNAHRQRADGAINRNEFLKITIKRSCEGVGSLVGTAVTLAIPVAGNFVGLTLGAIVGKAAGGFVGRNAACLLGKV